jgi:hypothetical protein
VTQIQLNGQSANSASVLWSTSGDGTFLNPTALNAIYYPGTNDKATLHVNLTLTASPVPPCTPVATSVRHITFDPCGVGVPGLKGNPFTYSLRPNPSGGIFDIYISGVIDEEVMIRVIDLSGKIVMSDKLMIARDKTDHRMDLSSLAKGIYFIRIETANGVKTSKMILQ